ncbi:MAG: phage tail protein [Bacteroidetes bacterium]|nr:phage tail protein [Bacteroidota bacterium]
MSQTSQAQDAYLGEIRLFAGNYAPVGWQLCNGQLLSISQNTALFSILGTTYGGNGTTTFALPDLRGRVPVHTGTGPGLSTYELGETGGKEYVTLLASQMSPAAPQLLATNQMADTDDPTNAVLAMPDNGTMIYKSLGSPNTNMSLSAIRSNGGGQPIEILQPYLGVNYIICTEGIWPSRQ